MKSYRISILILLSLVLASSAFAQKVLHVSTIPSQADIYVKQVRPDHADNPDYTSPAFIPVDENNSHNGEIMISLFNPTFADTTILVQLSDRDTSYLIVSQKPLLDETALEEQQGEISKRSRRAFGKKMMLFSIVPLIAGAASGAYTYYEIHKAKDSKKKLERSVIVESEHYRETENELDKHRNNAKYAKYATYSGVALGATLLSIGFILSF